MPTSIPIIHGAYVRDLLAQPLAIADTVAGLRQAAPWKHRATDWKRIVLTGMGSSLHALHPLQLRLVQAGQTAFMVETAELIHSQTRLIKEETLLIVVSQSGRSVETVQLLDLIRDRHSRPCVVGVTNTADSPLHAQAQAVVRMQAGPESTVSCKTYLATLVALEWLGSAILGDDLHATIADLETAAPAAQGYLTDWLKHVIRLALEFRGVQDIFITGRGSSLAAADTGGLILKEAAHVHAEGMSCPAFRHGPFEMIHDAAFIIVLEGDPATASLNQTLVRDVQAAGGRAALVGPTAERESFRLPQVSARLRPVLEILPIQMVSLAVAALAGREAGRFERASKTTLIP